MGTLELFVLGVGLSMDAFAVSVCKGLNMKKADWKGMTLCGVWFGGFQALMPFLGFWLGSMFADAIVAVDHWIAFGLLALLGINMIREACQTQEAKEECDADLSVKTMFLMAVATSIDALAVGISLAMAGNVNIYRAITMIGIITFLLSAAGVKIGSIFGNRFEKKAQITGGVILLFLGIKILIEHLR